MAVTTLSSIWALGQNPACVLSIGGYKVPRPCNRKTDKNKILNLLPLFFPTISPLLPNLYPESVNWRLNRDRF